MSSLLPADEREALCAQRMAWKPGRREITAWWDTLLADGVKNGPQLAIPIEYQTSRSTRVV